MGFWWPLRQSGAVILSHVSYKVHEFAGQHGHGKAGWGIFTYGCTRASSCYIAAFALYTTVPLGNAIKMTKVFHLIIHSD